nr:ISL3 family transposase [Carbonactinospora thermoautotrophica]
MFHTGGSVRIQASTRDPEAACPGCGVASGRVHSRYERRLSDTAISGQETLIHLRVRRFFCRNDECEMKIFCEQVPGLTIRYGRRSVGLGEQVRAVGLALGGRAGARLTHRLAAAVSRMTLLRMIRGLPDPIPAEAVRVLGVDDFALRRGHTYGTVLIDITTGRPIDVLPERSADCLAAWLSRHPGVEVVCRDRAGCYAEGAARGAPAAIQVADRWHIWRNLGDAVERTVAKHRACLHAATPVTAPAGSSEHATRAEPPPRVGAPAIRHGRLAERTRQRHVAIHALLAQGHSLRSIAQELQLGRNTVRRFARATSPEELLVNTGTGRRPKLLDEYARYLHQRWDEGCTDAAQLWQELRELGYRGSYSSVRDHVRPLRSGIPPESPPAPPKVRQVVGWIMRNPANLDADDQRRLEAILAACPELAAVRGHVRDFAHMMKHRRGTRLEKWMAAVEADDLPDLHSFITGLRRDLDAVTAGLTLPHSSGPVEGHVNRIKTIKRQMYGRAKPDLLRKRILLAD